MPHNNRVSTSRSLGTSDIWSKTIGHDPHATGADDSANREIESNAEKARGLLELARHQNLTGGRGGGQAGGDNFSRQLFLGLKGGKKRAADAKNPKAGVLDADTRALLEESSSSSEDEFVDERKLPAKAGSDYSSDASQKKKKRKRRKERSKRSKSKKRKRRKEKSRTKKDNSGDSDDSRAVRKRRRRRERDRDSSDEDNVHADHWRDATNGHKERA